MPLKFMRPYKLVVASDNYVQPTIAIGPRIARRANAEDKEAPVVEFLTIGESGHSIFGEPEDREEGIVEVVDQERVGDDGKQVVWRFIPLTLEVWTEMGETIIGFEKLKGQIQDEGTLVNFYIINFLEDYWHEDYKAAPP